MTILKRAFISTRRNKGKAYLLFFILLIMVSIISGSISANRATDNMERNLLESMFPMVMIQLEGGIDREYYIYSEAFTGISLSSELIREIGALPYVRDYDFFTDVRLYSLLKPYEVELEDYEFILGGMWNPWEDILGHNFILRGVQHPNIFDIELNVIELVNGRVFTIDEINNLSKVAIVSQEVATLNDLTVGSTISLRNIIFTPEAERMGGEFFFVEEKIAADESYDLKIIGIFEPTSLPEHNEEWLNHWINQEIQNRIYVSNTFAEMAAHFSNTARYELWSELMPESFDGVGDELIWRENFFVLYSPIYIDEFRATVEEILPINFRVVDANNFFIPISSALESMRLLTFTIMLGAIGATILTLSLLIIVFLRDRKHEIGIYVALGEGKAQIVCQFLFEVMIIAFTAIVVALFVGNSISANLSESMLMNDIIAQQERFVNEARNIWNPFVDMGLDTKVSNDVVLELYDTSLSFVEILVIILVSLGTTLLATVIPVFYIVRLNPKKIMM